MIIDCHNHTGVELLLYLRNEFPYAQQLVDLVSHGRECGVTHFIVFPMVTNLSLGIPAMRRGEITTEGALEKVPYIYENHRHLQEIYDFFPKEGKATLPFVMFDPYREQQSQAEALRKLRGQYKFYGLKTQTTILKSPIKSLLDKGKIFLELAEEWDIPMLIHSSVIADDTWAQASDILDVVEQFPQVRFCVAHSLRFDRVQLDRLSQIPNAWFDCSAHRIHCQLAAEDSPVVAPGERRFESDYTRPEQVLADLAEAYPKKLMWGSDSPYQSFVSQLGGFMLSLISTYKEEVECLDAVPGDLRHAVAAGNTLDFLKLPVDALS